VSPTWPTPSWQALEGPPPVGSFRNAGRETERGRIVLKAKTLRPVLDALAIRHELFNWLDHTLPRTSPCLVLNEVPLGLRLAFADVVIAGDELWGFEIKSDVDSLRRLAQQVRYYRLTFDRIVVVTSNRYAQTVDSHIPEAWGIYCVSPGSLEVVRSAQPNREMNPAWMLDLLRRDELDEISGRYGVSRRRRCHKDALIARLASALTTDECRQATCRAVRARDGWSARQLQTSTFRFNGFPNDRDEATALPTLLSCSPQHQGVAASERVCEGGRYMSSNVLLT